MNPTATPIFDAVVAETGVQWPGPATDDEPSPPEPQVTTADP